MTPAELYAEIRQRIADTPAAMALVDAVRNDSPPVPDTVAIAAAISIGRTKAVHKPIGRGEVALALGVPSGPLFVYQLSRMANTPPGDDATDAQVAAFATAWQAWDSLDKGTFDVGNPAVRSALDLFVGTLLTADQAAVFKALADVSDPYAEFDVRCAILADDGALLV